MNKKATGNETILIVIFGVVALIYLASYLNNSSVKGLFSTAGLTNQCEDSDFGQDVYASGTVSGGLHVFYNEPIKEDQADYCYTSTQVIEYYCDGVYRKSILLTCPSGEACINGLCTGGEAGGPLDRGTR